MMLLLDNNPILLRLLLISLFCIPAIQPAQAEQQAHLCESFSGVDKGSEATKGMVWIKPGTFTMGNNKGHTDKETGNFHPFSEEKYEHEVTLQGFWIDRHEVTNAQFAQFVKETSYKTVAERKPKKEWFPPGYPEEKMLIGSIVFVSPNSISNLNEITQWWQFVEGANWRHPQGPESTIKDKMNHPVVHIAYEDALAYAKWAGRSLPTEAQWEYAARGGLSKNIYSWGKYYKPGGKWMANTWQGKFPTNNSSEDGYVGTAPVGCYPANGYGLYDMAGNVWEIVLDRYQPGHHKTKLNASDRLSQGFDPNQPGIAKHVIKGGSYLCTPMYCMRYRPAARQPQDHTVGTSHIGFRTVLNKK